MRLSLRAGITKLWKNHAGLTATCGLMVVLLAGNLVGLAVDRRMITGAPAWLKPAKFSISTAIYSATLAWMIGQISKGRQFARAMGTVTAVMLVVEVFIINLQAWRGTTSHFNVSTQLDAALFGIMGFGIATLWLCSAGIAVVLFRQPFADRALGWALRLGMAMTVLGSASGGLMTRPMPGQTMKIIGAHTVGAPDGGSSLPVTGWSAEHGDLRIGHFLGLHGMQAIPLLYWWLDRRRKPSMASIGIGAAGYCGAFLLLDWQALRGQSIVKPDATTVEAWMGWLALVGGAAVLLEFSRGRKDRAPHTVSI